jgi:hypothetical protein
MSLAQWNALLYQDQILNNIKLKHKGDPNAVAKINTTLDKNQEKRDNIEYDLFDTLPPWYKNLERSNPQSQFYEYREGWRAEKKEEKVRKEWERYWDEIDQEYGCVPVYFFFFNYLISFFLFFS